MPWDYATGEWYDDPSTYVTTDPNDAYGGWTGSGTFRSSLDSQLANELLGLPSYSGSAPSSVDIGGTTYGFNALDALGRMFGSNAGKVASAVGLASLMNKMFGGSGGGGPSGYQGGIPKYTATRQMNPIPQTVTVPPAAGQTAAQTVPRRPGSGGISYFTPMQYTYSGVTPKTAQEFITPAPTTAPVAAAGGGIMSLAGGGYNLGGYSDGGRLLKGPGDGVSDSIPATIGGRQPARLADGEFVVPARIVSELGNGSTDAGARKLYAMMDRIKKARKKSNKDIAADTKADKYLPK